jgi:mono/diheme cytochrome c family protein
VQTLKISLITLAALLVIGLGLVYAGAFNVAADDPHWGVTYRLMETARERSVATRADSVPTAPALDDPQLIAMGAEHYVEMCTGCHLAPEMKDSEIRAGLYPKPPNLVEHGAHRSPQQTFWIIKHGLKMTGMPAWGVTHDDQSIWGLVAFLRKLPELSPDAYQELVAQSSGGHSHSDEGHSHGDEAAAKEAAMQPDHEHEGAQAKGETTAKDGHDHATHSHEAPAKTPAAGAPLPASAVEPIAVVDRFFRALASGDTNSAGALLDPKVLIYESGGAERSRTEYESHHLRADAAFLKTAQHRLLSRTGDAIGDLAWVATESRLTTKGTKATDLISTETMVLRKTSQGWRIVHIHWSSRPQGA